MYNFIEMSTFVSNNTVNITNIEDFENILQENGAKNIFFGQRTARNIEGFCFLVNINSVFYVFTYKSKYGVYKNIHDYKSGIKNKFANAIDYYIYEKNKNALNINEYLINEYNIDRNKLEEKDNDDKYREYLMEMMNKVFELEIIKEKYDVNMCQAIILYILNNYVENEILVKDFMQLCSHGIEIKSYINNDNRTINISDDFLEKWWREYDNFNNEKPDDSWQREKLNNGNMGSVDGYGYDYNKNYFLDILRNIKDINKLIKFQDEYIIKI